ncbi:MAG: protein BatD, partial [Bacteroidales bacterium]
MNKRLFALILTMSLTCAAFAQKFEAQVENLGKYYRLSFTVASKDAEHFTPPSLADFEVLSGPAQSSYSSVQFVNGKV